MEKEPEIQVMDKNIGSMERVEKVARAMLYVMLVLLLVVFGIHNVVGGWLDVIVIYTGVFVGVAVVELLSMYYLQYLKTLKELLQT